MMRFLRLSSICILFVCSCASPYKNLQKTPVEETVFRFQPEFDRVLYRCIVDGRFIFKKFHLSGVLFFKELKSGTIRAIFQNEMGMAFFDMEWKKDGTFEMKQVLPELNKEAVIKTLRKDMEMLLMIGLDKKSEILLKGDRGMEQVYRLNREEDYVYYITEREKLVRIENANNRKKVVSVNIGPKQEETSMPDTILFNHHKANFTISLTKI